MLIVLWRNWFINTSLTKQWLMHENKKLNSLFISFKPFAFSPLVKISNIYCISRNMNIKKIKKSLHFFKGQLGIINNFIITLLISIPFLCEYQYSLNQIIIKQMHKFLRLKLYFALKSAYRNNYRHICQLITDTKTYWYTDPAHSIIPNQFLYTLEPQISWASQWIEHSYMLWLTKKYILSISQRPQSHKYGLNQLKLIPRSHTHRQENKNRIGIPHLLSKPYPNIFISLSLSLSQEENDITSWKCKEMREREKRREEI